MKKNIAIITGGNSAEAGVSVKSAGVIQKHLSSEKYNSFLIYIDGSTWTYKHENQEYPIDKNDFSLNINNIKVSFDLVFVAIHGTPGEDGKIQSYFDLIGLPYTTSNSFECGLSFNKAMTNTYLRQFDIPCGKAIYLLEGDTIDQEQIVNEIGFPCFVKPNEAGSSFGISKVNSINEIEKAVANAFKHDKKVIIEEFLDGVEVTCCVHDFESQLTAFPLTEIVSENDFFDYEAKYEGKSDEITPARISTEDALTITETTKRIYRLLELKGVARADYILRKGTPYLIEINTVPGVSEESLVPQQAKAHGMELSEFFNNWAERFL